MRKADRVLDLFPGECSLFCKSADGLAALGCCVIHWHCETPSCLAFSINGVVAVAIAAFLRLGGMAGDDQSDRCLGLMSRHDAADLA
jgi:hypothetical protein